MVTRGEGLTFCVHLSSTSRRMGTKAGSRDGDVAKREGLLCTCVGGARRFTNFRMLRCFSSKCSKAVFGGETRFRELVRSTRLKEFRYVVMGSFSQFKESCLRMNGCLRFMFPTVKVEFVSIGSGCSDSEGFNIAKKVSMTCGGLVCRLCDVSLSEGMGDTEEAEGLDNRCATSFIYCKCGGSPSSGRGLVVSRRTTGIIIRVFSLVVTKCGTDRITHVLGREGVPAEIRGR